MADEFDSVARTFRKRTGLKLLAIILALICWYMIREETSYEQTVRGVTLEIKPPEGWLLRSQNVEKADVLFRGSRSDLRDLLPDDVQVEANVPKQPPNASSAVIRLSTADVHAPPGARALHVMPSSVTVHLEKR